ncbi:MAG: thioredoxin domain-containing protein [Proteobacteria bacterium]|nr:thioredoxin domain-containing protein [Pseudomonadota bacterium]
MFPFFHDNYATLCRKCLLFAMVFGLVFITQVALGADSDPAKKKEVEKVEKASGVMKSSPKKDQQGVNQVVKNPGKAMKIMTYNAPKRGASEAKVVVVKFSDFYCGKCKKLSTWLSEMLKNKKYVDKVSLVYMPYPVFGEKATKLTKEALCAGKQNKFWEFHDKAFASHGSGLDMTSGLKVATELSLNLDDFNQCVTSDKGVADLLKSVKSEGKKLKVSGTPGLFINGRKQSAKTKADLVKAIDSALAS